jgi:hypothetical protein
MFDWEYLGEEIPMEFVGGFVGICQEGIWLKPEIVWAIVEEGEVEMDDEEVSAI